MDYSLLSVFGPAAVAFLIVERFSKLPSQNLWVAAARLFALGLVNTLCTLFVFSFLGQPQLVQTADGVWQLSFSAVALAFAFLGAIVEGVVACGIMQRVHIELDVEKK